jgi:hypothetical protein
MRSVVVMRFNRVEVVQRIDGSVPAVTEPMPPSGPACPPLSARWLNHLHLPAYLNVDEPTCEEAEAHSYHRPGPIGDVGSGPASVPRGRRW